MTVSSLWKVLDEAGCGKPVGVRELLDPNAPPSSLQGVHPWNVYQLQQESPRKPKTVLAVDLSIWICESLCSTLMDNHKHPAPHLVFTRTVKLLSMGLGLVFVVEGKRRIRDAGITANDQVDKFRKRRNGTAFWKACRDCHDMLKLLGVPVVRAAAEGEALCALLNQRGVVDGVISNDGDCLLFGATVVYTKFSLDNLEHSKVVRYNLDELAAVVQAVDGGVDAEVGRLNLSRQDLMAFACLTGSDLAGSGLDKVGHKKAIRFIRKCQLDNPRQAETAAMDELKSWARSVAPREDDFDPFEPPAAIPKNASGPCCSCCQHAGSKRSHLKHGCEICGTDPGEACFESTSEDRFRRGLRAKALALFPKFDPSQVVAAYMRPNENQIPVLFAGNCRPRMGLPKLSALLKLKLIVKGRSYETSRDFIMQAVGRILSRAELEEPESDVDDDKENQKPVRPVRDKPVPLEITKVAIINSVPSYHITWRVGASLTDDKGNGIDGYEYSTVEQQSRVQKRFPALVETYKQAEKERLKQGDGEQNRRRVFVENLWIDVAAPAGEPEENKENAGDPSPRKRRGKKKRQDVFGSQKPPRAPLAPRAKNTKGGGDVKDLLRFTKGRSTLQNRSDSSIESVVDEATSNHRKELDHDDDSSRDESRGSVEETSSPATPLLCKFGSYWIPISPIDAMQPGEYPPRRIYVRRPRASDL